MFLYLKPRVACTLFSPTLTHSLSFVLPALCLSVQLCTCLAGAFCVVGKRPLSVINVWCVAVYVSNHNSSMKSPLPGSDRHACAHRALQCLLLYKADFKYSHFRGDALQWHEASGLNRSTALSLSLCITLSQPPLAFPLFYCDKTQQVMA